MLVCAIRREEKPAEEKASRRKRSGCSLCIQHHRWARLALDLLQHPLVLLRGIAFADGDVPRGRVQQFTIAIIAALALRWLDTCLLPHHKASHRYSSTYEMTTSTRVFHHLCSPVAKPWSVPRWPPTAWRSGIQVSGCSLRLYS